MNVLIGIWLYTSLIYQGQPINRPNPELKMYFTFTDEQTNEIYYHYENQPGYCKRTARYEFKNNRIIQTVIAVDEGNADFCAQDPDMQINRTSISELSVVDEKLHLTLPLGEDTLTYVWEKQHR